MRRMPRPTSIAGLSLRLAALHRARVVFWLLIMAVAVLALSRCAGRSADVRVATFNIERDSPPEWVSTGPPRASRALHIGTVPTAASAARSTTF